MGDLFMEDVSKEIADLKRQLAVLEQRVDTTSKLDEPSTRRDAFKKLAIGAAGALTAGGALAALSAEPAAAVDGDAVVVGGTYTAQTRTEVRYTGADAHKGVLAAIEGTGTVNGGGFLSFGSAYPAALSGWVYQATAGTAVRHGVYAFTDKDDGAALVASAPSGVNVRLAAFGSPAPSRAVTHSLGDVVVDSTGDAWICVLAGNPGTWRKLAGAGTAGALHLLPEPLRTYDSRSGSKLAAGSTTTVSLANGKNGAGATVAAVPAGASAVLANVTLTGTVGVFGFIQAYSAALASPPATSVMNWSSPDDSVANEMTIVVDATSQIKVTVGVAATHIIIDVVGYYR
jgi:hypothetical protein